MTPEVWQQVDRILNQALDLPLTERQPYIESVCRSDSALLAQVKTMLSAYDKSQDSFEPAALHPDQKLGAYRIIREIGRGGMGVVYLAERDDDQFRKQVAIKVIASTLGSGELVRRFRGERRILARLEHPNMARLLDAGATAEGLRYIVMEYVDGQPLNRYCAERRLGERDRLRLVQEICSVVQLAHRNLIVHRDIKPGNILVTADGVPKLLDFGIAKMLDPAEGPQEATVVQAMTPEYASPEQIAGRPVTTASDIYSLGVLLQKLLLNAAANADLIAITSKATREEPAERYASADELAADIDRYLTGLPVLARKRSTRYVIRKFVRRHPMGVAAAAVAVLLGAAGIGAIVRESRIANRKTAEAQLRFNQVRKLARSVMYELHDGIEALPGSTAVRSLLVRRSLEYLDALAKEGGGDDSLQLELADAYQRVGAVQGKVGAANLGDTAGALSSYTKARAILEKLLARRPKDLIVQTRLAKVLCDTANLDSRTGKKSEALAAAREAMRLGEVAYQQNPKNESALFARAAGYFQVALFVNGDEQKLAAWKPALAAYEEELARTPSDPNAMRNVGLVHKYMAGILVRTEATWPEARHHGELARDLDLRRLSLDSANRQAKLDLTFDLGQLAYLAAKQKDYQAELENYQKVDAIRQDLSREDPQDVNLKQRAAVARTNLGAALIRVHRVDEARGKIREALSVFQALHQQDPKDMDNLRSMGFAHEDLGEAAAQAKEAAAACAEYREAMRFFTLAKERIFDADQSEVEVARKGAAKCGPE